MSPWLAAILSMVLVKVLRPPWPATVLIGLVCGLVIGRLVRA